MKKGKTLLLFLSFLLLPLSMVGAPGENVRQRLLFNQDWPKSDLGRNDPAFETGQLWHLSEGWLDVIQP